VTGTLLVKSRTIVIAVSGSTTLRKPLCRRCSRSRRCFSCSSPPNNLGSLAYTYDANGRRTATAGSLAAVTLPANVTGGTSTVYNADNAQTNFNGTALSYDANGNLTSDGTNTYTWDARNHLTAINGGSTAIFTYDGFGRRVKKVIGGTTTQFLYDGLNPVQELNGAVPPSPTANLLTGLRIDEYFTRTDTATSTFLADALGSTVGLVGSGGTIATSYTYQPFGGTTAGGSASGNSYQFTGRENDGTGLYSYRARYYSPTFQRFIAQDPVGFRGGSSDLFVVAMVFFILWPEYAGDSLLPRLQRVIGDTLELAPSGSASSSEDQVLKTNSETMRVLTEILLVADDARMEGRTSAVDHNAIVEAAGTLRRIANRLSSIATGRILAQMPQLDPVTEFAREGVFDVIRQQLRSWLDFFSDAECLSASATRATAQKHSADELAEPLNEFSSHLEEGGFARMESWPLEQRRTMLAELQSMRQLEFLFSELNRYLADVPSPPRRASRIVSPEG